MYHSWECPASQLGVPFITAGSALYHSWKCLYQSWECLISQLRVPYITAGSALFNSSVSQLRMSGVNYLTKQEKCILCATPDSGGEQLSGSSAGTRKDFEQLHYTTKTF